jgi:hypothetical protein
MCIVIAKHTVKPSKNQATRRNNEVANSVLTAGSFHETDSCAPSNLELLLLTIGCGGGA